MTRHRARGRQRGRLWKAWADGIGVLLTGSLALTATSLVWFTGTRLLARDLVRRQRAESGPTLPRAFAEHWWFATAPLALVTAGHLLAGRPSQLFLVTLAIGLSAAVVRVPWQRLLVAGGLTVVVLAGGLAAERLVAGSTWFASGETETTAWRWWSAVRGVAPLAGSPDGVWFERLWSLPSGGEQYVVAFEARAVIAAPEAGEEVRTLVGLGAARAGREHANHRPFSAASSWQAHTFTFAATELQPAERLRTSVLVEGTGRLEVRGMTVRSQRGEAVPQAYPVRQRLWFGHPNLAGHALAMLAASVLVVSRRLQTSLVLGIVALAGIYFTGSRTATAVFIIFLPVWWWLVAPHRWRWPLLLGIVAAMALAFMVVDPSSLGRIGVWSLDDRNVVSRIGEMRAAIDALAAAPWSGVGEGALPDLAHNAWLQVAAEYGIPGAVAMMWLTIAAMLVALRWAGPAGLTLVLALFALQLSDDTWHYTGVFVSLMLGLTALAERRRATPS